MFFFKFFAVFIVLNVAHLGEASYTYDKVGEKYYFIGNGFSVCDPILCLND